MALYKMEFIAADDFQSKAINAGDYYATLQFYLHSYPAFKLPK